MKTKQLTSHVLRCLLIACFGLGILPAAEKLSWKIEDIRGKAYVPVDQIGEFYRLGEAVRDGSSVKFDNGVIQMELEIDSKVCYLNTVKIVFSNSVAEKGNATYVSKVDLAVLVESILRPDRIAVTGDLNTVILDPAIDPAIGNELGAEGDFPLSIANITKKTVEAKGFTVVMTRNKDKVRSPDELVDLANKVEDPAVFIGISLNTGSPDENGFQTFIVAREVDVTASDPFGMASVALSVGIHGAIIGRLGTNTSDRGVTRGELGAYSRIRHPAVVLMAGFVSHERDSRLIANATYQTAVAEGIVNGFVRYRFAVRNNELSKAKDASDKD